jgi:hypothetical protein
VERYLAYGLDLRSSFSLPGMPLADASAGSLPSLSLKRVERDELTRAWSGPQGSPRWSATLGDGRQLTIEDGRAGDLLFSYGDRAVFKLDRSRQALLCACSGPGLDWQRVLLSKVLASISLLRGREALHASAVCSPNGVVAIAAPSGAGKTTLAVELVRRGWPLFCDDVLLLDREARSVRAHPGTPHLNVPAGIGAETSRLGATLGLLDGERWVSATSFCRESAPIALVCLLDRRSGSPLSVEALPPGPQWLAPYMIGLDDSTERERRRFALYADLVGSAALVRLRCDSSSAPAQLAEQVESLIAQRQPTATGAGI